MFKHYTYIILACLLLIGCKQTQSVSRQTSPTPADTITNDPAFLYFFYAAQDALYQADYNRAMALLNFTEQLNPQDAATQQSLGYMYQGLQQQENALRHYARAFSSDPTMYWSNYASLLFQADRKDEAAAVLEQAVSLLPNDTDPMEALSSVYAALGNYKAALKVQDKIEAIEGITAFNTTNRYRILMQAGDTRKAVQVVERYCTQHPEDIRFQVFRGDLYLITNREQEALQLYEQLYRKHPEEPYVCLALAQYAEKHADADRAAYYTEQAIQSEEWDVNEKLQAISQYEKRLTDANLVEPLLQQLVTDYPLEEQTYMTLARYYVRAQRYPAAKPVLQTLLTLNPQSTTAYQLMMDVLQTDSLSSNDEYAALIRQAYRQLPNDLEWTYWMTRVLLVEQQTDSAIAVARRGVSIETDDARYRLPLWILLGDMYSVKEQYDSTYLCYEEALRLDPQNIYTLNNYAYMLAIHGGDLRKAEQMSQKTIEKEPDNATYLDTYAWILHLQGERMLAEFYIRKAMDKMTEIESEDIKQHYEEIIQQK